MKLTEGISEICGTIIGDGWIQSNERNMFITGSPTEDKFYYDNYLVPLLNKEIGLKLKGRNFISWRTYGIGIYQKQIIHKFLEIGIPKGKKSKIVFVPKCIRDKKKFFIPLLRGIFDTDGSIYFMKDPNKKSKFHTRPRIRIVSVSERLVKDIKDLSDILNIKYSNPSASIWGKNPNPSFIFEINRIESINRWWKIVGSNNPAHKTRYKIWKKYGFVPPRTNLNERIRILKRLINPESFY
jgi:hypothetical protein